MQELANTTTQAEILWGSDMLGTVILGYFFLLLILFVSFLNIYAIDRYEFLGGRQFCVRLKHKIPFLIIYSKEKHIVSKKTLILELIGYFILILSITTLICSFKQDVSTAIILLGIVALLISAFGWVTGSMYGKTKKGK